MKKFLLTIIKIIISLSILLYLLYKLNFSEVYKTILAVSIFIIILIILRYFGLVFINSLNLKILTKSLRLRVSLPTLFKYNLLSYAVGQYSPGRAGEISLAYFLNKKGISYGEGTAVFIMDKLISTFALIVFSIFGFFIFFPKILAIKVSLLLIAFLAGLCFFLILKKTRKFAKKYILRKYSSKFKGFSRNLLYLLKRKKRFLLLNVLITFGRILFGGYIIYLILLFFDIKISFFLVPTISSVGIISSSLPISISGLGVRESIVVYLYSQFNVAAVIIGSVYLLITFLHYIISAISILPIIIEGSILKDIKSIGLLKKQDEDLFPKENKEKTEEKDLNN